MQLSLIPSSDWSVNIFINIDFSSIFSFHHILPTFCRFVCLLAPFCNFVYPFSQHFTMNRDSLTLRLLSASLSFSSARLSLDLSLSLLAYYASPSNSEFTFILMVLWPHVTLILEQHRDEILQFRADN